MSVQIQQFRVAGVNTQTGEDVSVVIDAATKAAAEVKAEKMHIDTTHIVRLKQDTPEPPSEHELFSAEAAEALAGQRTINLVEECVSHENNRATPAQAASAAGAHPRNQPHTAAPATTKPTNPEPEQVVAAVSRLSYAAPTNQRDQHAAEVSGTRAFALVLVVLLGISAGAYFVLVHQPNSTIAHDQDLIFGQDLFSDVLDFDTSNQQSNTLRDAFDNRSTSGNAAAIVNTPPIAPNQQRRITNPPQAESASPAKSKQAQAPPKLKLQSIVTTNKGRFAVINGKLYEQGHDIGTAKLVSVANDWVLIERDGKQFTLQITTQP